MDQLPKHEVQEINERMYSRKFIDTYLHLEIQNNPDHEAKVQQGVALLDDWLSHSYFPSKDERLKQVRSLNIEQLVRDVIVATCYCQRPEMFTSVTAQIAARLGFSEKKDGIHTMAEIVAVLCDTDAYDISRVPKGYSLVIQSALPLSDQMIQFAEQSEFLPPMVCQPQHLTKNNQSGYLTHNDSLVLGKGNHHEGDLCLDVLNIMNSVPLRLCPEFLSAMEEEPSSKLDQVKKMDKKPKYIVAEQIRQKRENWYQFKAQSHEFYKLMVKQGNRFYFTHKPDCRGRIYSQGYHINPQGTSYKKAMIELANKEVVKGVPT